MNSKDLLNLLHAMKADQKRILEELKKLNAPIDISIEDLEQPISTGAQPKSNYES